MSAPTGAGERTASRPADGGASRPARASRRRLRARRGRRARRRLPARPALLARPGLPARLGLLARRGLLVTLTLVAAACGLSRATPDTRYYTLAIPGTPRTALARPVRVANFTADQPYATARLAYRSSPYVLEYYAYHRWAGDPRVVVATAVRDYLERAPAGAGEPLEVGGNVRRLEEIDAPEGWQGAVALDLRLSRGDTVVLERSYAETEPAATRTPEGVVAAQSRALGRIIDRALAELP